jgi:DNA-binding CsgD family transcriptional regulator
VLDVRLGLGLGPVEYRSENQSLSDGTAFRLAAHSLEAAYQDKLGFIRFASESEALDAQVNTIFVAIEPYLSKLTAPQAESLWWSMTGLTQTEIADKLEVAQPTVNRALQSAHDKHITYIRTYLRDCIARYLSHEPLDV